MDACKSECHVLHGCSHRHSLWKQWVLKTQATEHQPVEGYLSRMYQTIERLAHRRAQGGPRALRHQQEKTGSDFPAGDKLFAQRLQEIPTLKTLWKEEQIRY